MKKSVIYTIIILVIVVLAVCTIIFLNNGKKNNNTNANANVPSNNEAVKMTDDELVNNIISGEKTVNLDTPESDDILTNIDNVLNEKDPLTEMPGNE